MLISDFIPEKFVKFSWKLEKRKKLILHLLKQLYKTRLGSGSCEKCPDPQPCNCFRVTTGWRGEATGPRCALCSAEHNWNPHHERNDQRIGPEKGHSQAAGILTPGISCFPFLEFASDASGLRTRARADLRSWCVYSFYKHEVPIISRVVTKVGFYFTKYDFFRSRIS